MNPYVNRLANRARARVVASHWRQRWEANHPAAVMPLPFLGYWWPHVERSAPGPLRWPAYRWPLNVARWCVAQTWPGTWTGQRNPTLQCLARLVWTVAAGAGGVVALLVASLFTVAAVPVYVAANLAGAGLVVFGGWSAPNSSIEGLDTSRLDAWAADVDPGLVEPPVSQDPPSQEGPVDASDWNNANDPLLAAQLNGTAELRRHNDLLEAQARAHQAAHSASGPVGPYQSPPARPAAHRGRRRLLWSLLGVSVLLAAGLLAGAFMLSVAATWNRDAVPPTFAEIEAGIHARTAERSAERQAEFETRDGDGAGQ